MAARLYRDAMAMLRRHEAAAKQAAQARGKTAALRCAPLKRSAVAKNELTAAPVVQPSTLVAGVLPGHAVHFKRRYTKVAARQSHSTEVHMFALAGIAQAAADAPALSRPPARPLSAAIYGAAAARRAAAPRLAGPRPDPGCASAAAGRNGVRSAPVSAPVAAATATGMRRAAAEPVWPPQALPPGEVLGEGGPARQGVTRASSPVQDSAAAPRRNSKLGHAWRAASAPVSGKGGSVAKYAGSHMSAPAQSRRRGPLAQGWGPAPVARPQRAGAPGSVGGERDARASAAFAGFLARQQAFEQVR